MYTICFLVPLTSTFLFIRWEYFPPSFCFVIPNLDKKIHTQKGIWELYSHSLTER